VVNVDHVVEFWRAYGGFHLNSSGHVATHR
jgi:hypothetical protein